MKGGGEGGYAKTHNVKEGRGSPNNCSTVSAMVFACILKRARSDRSLYSVLVTVAVTHQQDSPNAAGSEKVREPKLEVNPQRTGSSAYQPNA